ncbi:MAG: hypothetical protein ABI388_07825 [Bacteroidia bacterium]
MKKTFAAFFLLIALHFNCLAQTASKLDSIATKYEYAILQWAKGEVSVTRKGKASVSLNLDYKAIDGNMYYEDNLQWKIAALEYMDKNGYEFVSASSSLLYFRKKKN